jgi:hypothetical protein
MIVNLIKTIDSPADCQKDKEKGESEKEKV